MDHIRSLAEALEIAYPLPGDEDDLPRLVLTIRRRAAGARAGVDAAWRAARTPPPASSAAMAALRETTGSESGEESCAVCLEEFKAEEKLREMPCGHCYHEGCIFPWLRVSGACPLCRQRL